jgi:alpha-N-acetylglucosamine transferase
MNSIELLFGQININRYRAEAFVQILLKRMRKKLKQTIGVVCFCLAFIFTVYVVTTSESRIESGAFVTFLSNDEYLPGARVLHQSIKNTGSKYRFVVMITDEVSQQARMILTADGCILKEIAVLPNPKSDEVRYKWVYSKLRAWELTEYDRIVFLDSDAILVKNIDELFSSSLQGFCVVADCW